MTELGKALRELRLCRKWTQAQFAARCGLSAVMIRFCETGRRLPQPQTFYRILQGLQTTPQEGYHLRSLYMEQCRPFSSMRYVRYAPDGKEIHEK